MFDVSLAWLREKGIASIPKAIDPNYQRDHWSSRDLNLDYKDVELIDGLHEDRQYDPDYAPDW